MKPLAAREFASRFGDGTDVLVAHDGGFVVGRMRVEFDIGAADAGNFHLQQRAVGGDIRHGIFADFGFARADSHGCYYFFHVGIPCDA